MATEHLLHSAASSIRAGSSDAAVATLLHAVRCLRCIEDERDRQYWELRWYLSWMGCEMMLSSSLLGALSREFEHDPVIRIDRSAPAFYQLAFMYILRPFAQRMSFLLLDPASSASRGLSAAQIQEAQFLVLAALWLSSMPQGTTTFVASCRPLYDMAQAATGPDAEYYKLEAIYAMVVSLHVVDGMDEYSALLHGLASNAHFRRLLDGELKLTRISSGFSVMARLPPVQAAHLWRHGQFAAALRTVEQMLQLLPSTMHPASLIFGNAYALRVLLPFGRHETSIRCLRHIVSVLPTAERAPGELWPLLRTVAQIALRVWESGSNAVSDEEAATLLSLVQHITTDGGRYSINLLTFVSPVPGLGDYAQDLYLPLPVLEAFQAMVRRYPEHNTGVWRSEHKRRAAVVCIRRLQAGTGDRQQLLHEANELLTQAQAVTYDSIVSRLLCVCTLCELRMEEGRDIAESRTLLQAALQSFTEQDAPVITLARHLMQRLDDMLAERAEGDTSDAVSGRCLSVEVEEKG